MISKRFISVVIAAIALALAFAAPAQAVAMLTIDELVAVRASEASPISVGVIPGSEPMCFWDEEKGCFSGVFIEVLNAISERTGLTLKYQAIDLKKGVPIKQLKDGSLRLAAGVLKTQRFLEDDALALSDGLYNASMAVVGRKGMDFITDPTNKTLALMANFEVGSIFAEENFPEHNKIYFDSIKGCLDAVAEGRADATAHINCCINYLLQNPHYEDLEISLAYMKNIDTCVVGLADDRILIDIINKGLAMISDSERVNMMMNYTITNPYRLTSEDIFYKYRWPIAVTSLLVIIIILSLAIMVVYRRRSENELKAAYEQEKAALAVAEKASAAKGSFMSRISHEIRTPLNAVIGYNSIARSTMSAARTDAERRQADMKLMDCLVKSDIASKHLLTIINDVLDMSAIESGRIKVAAERFDFKEMIASITALFSTQAKTGGVDFEVIFGTLTEEWFIGDQMRINQILTNLLSNAVKFTPEGGSVRMTIEQLEANDERARIRFVVTDTGIGMEQSYIEHIWTPFEQADSTISRRFGGTGLGLSITKNLVGLMNGSIDVKSELGKGTAFTVELELKRAKQQAFARVHDFSGVYALVADDEPSACEYVKLLFERCGARCRTVSSGSEALAAFSAAEAAKNGFTFCLLDWHMPGLDGIAAAGMLRAAGLKAPIALMTAYDYMEIAEEARKAGVDIFVAKPLFQSTLFDLLANMSGGLLTGAGQGESLDFTGMRILLAEDNKMNMEVAISILEGAGLQVDGAWNGREAVEKFAASEKGTYQAVLMDVQMPEMGGYEATRKLRACGHPDARTVPIIAMTADAFAENITAALESGMNDHISKPIDISLLFETLHKYFDKR